MLFAVFVLSALVALASAQLEPSSPPGGAPVFVPTGGSELPPTSPPVRVVESLGPTTGKSCLARVGPVCTFNRAECCTATKGDTIFIPGLAVAIPCVGAKVRFNSTLTSAFTDEQCLALQAQIEYSAGDSLCQCLAAPTPAPEILGACAKRANGSAYTVCDFLPADKTNLECCPANQLEGLLNPDPSVFDGDYISCDIANRSLHNNKSAFWDDERCYDLKLDVEREAERFGCVCPDSNKLNTSAPSRAPAAPTKAPTTPPTSGVSSMSMGAAVLGILGFFL